jgi:hypothetical protein
LSCFVVGFFVLFGFGGKEMLGVWFGTLYLVRILQRRIPRWWLEGRSRKRVS